VKLLAFDTSTSTCTVAICDNSKVIQSNQDAPRQHGKLLLPMIHSLLFDIQLQIEQIDAIIYGAGPGSYTGVRIASSTCQALAYALNKPVIQFSSLLILAQTAWHRLQWQKVIVLQDARMGQLYCACYSLQEGYMQPLHADCLLTVEESVTFIYHHTAKEKNRWYGVGNGWELLPPPIWPVKGQVHFDSLLTPDASAMIELGKEQYSKGHVISPDEAQPIYLR
jgi:tRNA threonylcarbamoyladenosine biosynthesis protein TsaB